LTRLLKLVGRFDALAVIRGVSHLLKSSEVVRRLGTSRSWLYQSAKDGRIPSIRLGGEDGPLRFVEEDLERWIDEARAAWRPGGTPVPTRSRHAARPRQNVRHSHARADWLQLDLRTEAD
jgi:excisionase family DNA binding protein